MSQNLSEYLHALPLIAILRGLKPEEAIGVGEVLLETGFRVIEVPLNSPEPLRSIELLAQRFGEQALIGAGTVMSANDVDDVTRVGGRLIVMPHFDEYVDPSDQHLLHLSKRREPGRELSRISKVLCTKKKRPLRLPSRVLEDAIRTHIFMIESQM